MGSDLRKTVFVCWFMQYPILFPVRGRVGIHAYHNYVLLRF
jgi:hypothetical protein